MYYQENNLSWEGVERLDWHLWLLAIFLIFVLGVSLLAFMFPTVFWVGKTSAIDSPERAFFGFCILLALVLVYLLQKQAAIRCLKRQLFDAQTAIEKAEREAAAKTFLHLPGTIQLRDALAMEYRRASVSVHPLAQIVLRARGISVDQWGSLVRLLRSMLRKGESIYRVSDEAVVVVLPGMQLTDAADFAQRFEELSGMPKGELESDVTSFPDKAATLTELEAQFRSPILAVAPFDAPTNGAASNSVS